MKSLWAHQAFLDRRIASVKLLLLFLDYDGTLTPITHHPSRAHLPADTKRLLQRLVSLPGLWIALVSGRALRDLKRMVGVRGLYYIGNHGLELQGPHLRYVNPVAQARRPLLKRIAGKLRAALQPIPGAWVEEKGFTFSVHWRAVPRSAQRTFHQLLKALTAPYLKPGGIRLTRGKRVVEIRPAVDWDKGIVVDWLLKRLAGRDASTRHWITYLGDDQTDEDAFRVVNRLGGTSVFVGDPRRRTGARYWLKDPQAVHSWLAELERWKRWNSSKGP